MGKPKMPTTDAEMIGVLFANVIVLMKQAGLSENGIDALHEALEHWVQHRRPN